MLFITSSLTWKASFALIGPINLINRQINHTGTIVVGQMGWTRHYQNMAAATSQTAIGHVIWSHGREPLHQPIITVPFGRKIKLFILWLTSLNVDHVGRCPYNAPAVL